MYCGQLTTRHLLILLYCQEIKVYIGMADRVVKREVGRLRRHGYAAPSYFPSVFPRDSTRRPSQGENHSIMPANNFKCYDVLWLWTMKVLDLRTFYGSLAVGQWLLLFRWLSNYRGSINISKFHFISSWENVSTVCRRYAFRKCLRIFVALFT